MTKLRPCPFCGGKAWAYSGTTYHFESGWGWICVYTSRLTKQPELSAIP